MIDAKGKGPYAKLASPMMTLPSPAHSPGFFLVSSLLCMGSRVRGLVGSRMLRPSSCAAWA